MQPLSTLCPKAHLVLGLGPKYLSLTICLSGGFVRFALTEPSSPKRPAQFRISLEYAELTKDGRTGSFDMSLLSLCLKARLTQNSLGLKFEQVSLVCPF